jgi:DNA modification methylase
MNKVLFGDCRESMEKMIAEGIKVQTCVTSPPYYGLRDYGHEGQIGLEDTPEDYVQSMVEVFRGVWDLLEDDGTLWLNIGDSYCGTGSKGDHADPKNAHGRNGQRVSKTQKLQGYKSKDLIGIPWMLAFALRADGWYLRQDIIWHKPSPMPESVKDRCTKSHEYIFLLSKSPTYYFNHEAIQEPAIYGDKGSQFNSGKTAQHRQARASKKRGDFNDKTNSLEGRESFRAITEMRNKRDVWTVPTRPYSGAHFAVFPPNLITPCILAGSRVGDVILDPFFGSGTTGQVAQEYGRQWIGCELNTEYEPLQKARTSQQSLALAPPPTEDKS